jgi:hypothetical protein
MRRTDDGLGVLLECNGESLEGTYSPGTMPPDLVEKLQRQENISQLVLLVNYYKFYDKFTPLLTLPALRDYVERHRGEPVPQLPSYEIGDDGEKILTYFAEAPIRGNPLYVIACQVPISDSSPCDARPA